MNESKLETIYQFLNWSSYPLEIQQRMLVQLHGQTPVVALSRGTEEEVSLDVQPSSSSSSYCPSLSDSDQLADGWTEKPKSKVIVTSRSSSASELGSICEHVEIENLMFSFLEVLHRHSSIIGAHHCTEENSAALNENEINTQRRDEENNNLVEQPLGSRLEGKSSYDQPVAGTSNNYAEDQSEQVDNELVANPLILSLGRCEDNISDEEGSNASKKRRKSQGLSQEQQVLNPANRSEAIYRLYKRCLPASNRSTTSHPEVCASPQVEVSSVRDGELVADPTTMFALRAGSEDQSSASRPRRRQTRRKRYLRTRNTRDEDSDESVDEEEDDEEQDSFTDSSRSSLVQSEPLRALYNVAIPVSREESRQGLEICWKYLSGCCSSGDCPPVRHLASPDQLIASANVLLETREFRKMEHFIRKLIHERSPVKIGRVCEWAAEIVRIASTAFFEDRNIFMIWCMLLSDKFPCVEDVCMRLFILPDCLNYSSELWLLCKRLKRDKVSFNASTWEALVQVLSETKDLDKILESLDVAVHLCSAFCPTSSVLNTVLDLLIETSDGDRSSYHNSVVKDKLLVLVGRLRSRMPSESLGKLQNLCSTTKSQTLTHTTSSPSVTTASLSEASTSQPLTQDSGLLPWWRNNLKMKLYKAIAEDFLKMPSPAPGFIEDLAEHIFRDKLASKALFAFFQELEKCIDLTDITANQKKALNSLVLKSLRKYHSQADFENSSVIILAATNHVLMDWVMYAECQPIILLFSAEICSRLDDIENAERFLTRFEEMKITGRVEEKLYPLEEHIRKKLKLLSQNSG